MIRKRTITTAVLTAALAVAGTSAFAQDIHFTQFDASPLIVNPAFTGAFDGTVRATAIYRNQWQSVTVPFKTYAASIDAPLIHDITVDDYLAGGIQLYNDEAGDGNLSNFSALASVAYHKFLGGNGSHDPTSALTIGFQGGYTEKSVDLSKLYFGDQYSNGGFNLASYEALNNRVKYFTVNAGIAFSQSLGDKFGYTVGAGANNLNQPLESFEMKEKSSQVGLGIRYTGQAGAIWYLNDVFSVRPGVLYQTQATAYELIAGSEFNLIVGSPEFRSIATKIFVGGWYRNGDAAMVTAGVEYKNLRIGASYDYNTSALKAASNGNGGFEISIRYIAPSPLDFARRLVYPCSRF